MYESFLTGKPMDRATAMDLMQYMASPECSDAFRAAVLSVLRVRGVTEDEMMGFYEAMHAPNDVTDATDIVGTGGDMAHTINVSTASAIVAASMGLKIAKFGNRSASGNHGAADFMSETGYAFPKSTGEALRRLSRTNFVFLYAPDFLKEFALFAGVRKMLGFPTVLNFLGPILNPLSPIRRVIGTSDPSFMELYAGIARRSGMRAIILHSADGMDEISPFAKARIMHVSDLVSESYVDASSLTGPLERRNIASADPGAISGLTLSAIRGENEDGARFVALNTAPVLIINGLASDIQEGYEAALEHIMSGGPAEFLKVIAGDR